MENIDIVEKRTWNELNELIEQLSDVQNKVDEIRGLVNGGNSNVRDYEKDAERFEHEANLELIDWNTFKNIVEADGGTFVRKCVLYSGPTKYGDGLNHGDTFSVSGYLGFGFRLGAVDLIDLSYIWASGVIKVLDLSGAEFIESLQFSLEGLCMNCAELVTLKLPGMTNVGVCNISKALKGCGSLASFEPPDGFCENIKCDWSETFGGCSSLRRVGHTTDVLDISNVCNEFTGIHGMFAGVPVSNVKLPNELRCLLSDFSCMFDGCFGLSYIAEGNKWSISVVADGDQLNLNRMFAGCENITNMHLNDWYVNALVDIPVVMESMFEGCTQLQNVSIFAFGKITNAGNWFKGCEMLTRVDMRDCVTNTTPIVRGAFKGCTSKLTVIAPAVTMSYFVSDPSNDKGTGLGGKDKMQDTYTVNNYEYKFEYDNTKSMLMLKTVTPI